jgi:hypothetical protein
MRISSEQRDEAFHPYYGMCRVFLGGVERKYVVSADEGKRHAVTVKLNGEGNPVIKAGEIQTEDFWGDVRIECPDWLRKEQEQAKTQRGLAQVPDDAPRYGSMFLLPEPVKPDNWGKPVKSVGEVLKAGHPKTVEEWRALYLTAHAPCERFAPRPYQQAAVDALIGKAMDEKFENEPITGTADAGPRYASGGVICRREQLRQGR